jgi:hypothetical protein
MKLYLPNETYTLRTMVVSNRKDQGGKTTSVINVSAALYWRVLSRRPCVAMFSSFGMHAMRARRFPDVTPSLPWDDPSTRKHRFNGMQRVPSTYVRTVRHVQRLDDKHAGPCSTTWDDARPRLASGR